MQTTTIGFALAIGFLLFAIIKLVLSKSGKRQKVFCEIYELVDTNLVRINAGKLDISWVKEDFEGIQKLHLPKLYGSYTLEPPSHGDYVPNTKGIRLVQLLKTGVDHFTLIKPTAKLQKKVKLINGVEHNIDNYLGEYAVVERDVAYWSELEHNRVREAHKVESGWDKIKPYVALGSVIIAAVMIMYFAIDKAGELVSDAKEEREATLNFFQKFAENPTSFANKVTSIDEDVETEATKPPGK